MGDRQRRQRRTLSGALALLCGLGLLACEQTPTRELAGAAVVIDGAVYFELPCEAQELVFVDEYARFPAALEVDVHADAIYLQHDRLVHVIRRSDDRHHTLSLGSDSDAELLAVPARDDLLVWSQSTKESSLRRVFAAPREDLDQRWVLFDYQADDAMYPPVVVGDQVALPTKQGIVHASLDGGEVGVLPLTLPLRRQPKPPEAPQLTAQGQQLVWIADDDDGHFFVVSTDATFTAEVIEYQELGADTWLVAAAKLGDELLVVTREHKGEDELSTLVLTRHDAAQQRTELWRRGDYGERLRLVSDGERAWLLLGTKLWQIDAHGHALVSAFVPRDELEPRALGIDDGVLLWTTFESGVLSYHANADVAQPLRIEPVVGNSDDDVWGELRGELRGDLGGDQIGEIGAIGLIGVEQGEREPQPRVRLQPAKLDGELDPDMLRRIIRAHVPELRSCYRAGLRRDPELSGTVEIEFVIDANGRVQHTKNLSGQRCSDREVSSCFATALRRWQFPRPGDGERVRVTYPFELSPG